MGGYYDTPPWVTCDVRRIHKAQLCFVPKIVLTLCVWRGNICEGVKKWERLFAFSLRLARKPPKSYKNLPLIRGCRSPPWSLLRSINFGRRNGLTKNKKDGFPLLAEHGKPSK